MKGLLSSHLLKGPTGVKRLSKSLFRHSKLRKRSRRSALIISREALSKPDIDPSVFEVEEEGEEEEEEEEEEEDDHDREARISDCVGGFNIANDEFPVSVKSHSQDDENANNGNDEDVTIAEIKYNAERQGKEVEASATNECIDDGTDDDDDDGNKYKEEHITKIESTTEGSKEEEEDGEQEDFSCVASGHNDVGRNVPTYDVHNEVIMIEDSFIRQENSANMKEEDGDVRGNFPKGPIISPDWEAAMLSVADIPSAIVFICGGKNSGKSTFARYLVNSLLNRYDKVGFLDTDVGQPEFTPSGCLSLHVLDKPFVGLPALEMKDPERCYFFGDISPKSNPEDYLKSVFSLYDHFKNKYILNYVEGEVSIKDGRLPLVINTHGWIQGVGFEALIRIIDHVLPTHIVQILSKTPSKNLPNRFWELGTTNPCNSQLLYINNALGESTHLSEIKFDARELRDLRLLSYFQKSLKDKLMSTSRLSFLFEKAATALACCKPFEVPVSAIKVVHQHFQLPACESLYSLNAALVGLGASDNRLQDMKPRCVGLGIVRAVDILQGIFYVITPLKLEELQQVDTFLSGRVEIPVSLLKAPGYVSPYLCHNSISIEGTGSAVMGKGRKKALHLSRTSEIL